MFDRDMRSFQLYDCAEISFDGSGRFIIPRICALWAA
jgi:MraZ protein